MVPTLRIFDQFSLFVLWAKVGEVPIVRSSDLDLDLPTSDYDLFSVFRSDAIASSQLYGGLRSNTIASSLEICLKEINCVPLSQLLGAHKATQSLHRLITV